MWCSNVSQYFSLPPSRLSLELDCYAEHPNSSDGIQACKSGSTRQNAQCIFISLNFKSLIAIHFVCPGFVTFSEMLWQKCIIKYVSGGNLIVAIFKKKEKIQAKDLLQCEQVWFCCHRQLCQKQQICLHILLHHSRCALQVNTVQKIPVSVGFVKSSSCIDRPFDLIFLL